MPPKGYKTVICKFWENNMCAKGSTCTFAHGPDELQRFSAPGLSAGLSAPSPLKLDRFKTKLCLFHMQSRCSKGTHCPYAHGMQELRGGAAGFSPPLSGPDIAPAAFFQQQQQQQQQQGGQNMGVPASMMGKMGGMHNMGKMPMGKEEELYHQRSMAQLQAMMASSGSGGNPRNMNNLGNMMSMSPPKDEDEPLLFTSVDQDSEAPKQMSGSFDSERGLRENDGDLDAAQQMAAMRYFAAQRVRQQRVDGKMSIMGGMQMGGDMYMQNMPDNMNSAAASYGFRG
jgi:hypothetical protein